MKSHLARRLLPIAAGPCPLAGRPGSAARHGHGAGPARLARCTGGGRLPRRRHRRCPGRCPVRDISGYLDIPAGDHNVKVYATGTTTGPVIDADVTVAAGAAYTIAATNAVAAIEAQVLQDVPEAACDTAKVRVVHFSADAPAVDVATTGSAPADAVVKALTYPTATDYLALPGGSYDLEVRLAGTTTVALALPGVAVEDCNAYSVFAVGSAAAPPLGDNALQVVVPSTLPRSEPAAERRRPTRNGRPTLRRPSPLSGPRRGWPARLVAVPRHIRRWAGATARRVAADRAHS